MGSVETPLQQHASQELVDDPRSPTTEFERTPIIVPQKNHKLLQKLHNKNLDNARKQLVTITPNSKRIPSPKLLETTPVAYKTENKRKSMVGVLETNLDFKETDLDEVIQKKLECDNLVDFNKSIGIYEEIDADPRSPTLDFARTPLQVLKKVGEIQLNDSHNSQESLNSVEEEEPVVLPKDELTVVKNFDKKLTNLIYEDKKVDIVQKTVKSKDTGSRTPLGARNCNEQNGKVVSKLRVSDRPLKSSKIPVFREKRGKGVVQCENTPPRSMPESTINKPKKSQWDADRTLLI